MGIITLIKDYVSGLIEAKEEFLEHLDTLDVFDQNVCELSRKMAADFIGLVLTDADQLIRESGIRKKEYTVQRERLRTLVSSIGDISFTHTLYRDRDGMIEEPARKKYTEHQHEMQRYAESMYAELVDKRTVRKILAIREQIGNI